LEQIEQTNQLVKNTTFSLDVNDPNAAFQALAAVAQKTNWYLL
jgi:hypothetical protein